MGRFRRSLMAMNLVEQSYPKLTYTHIGDGSSAYGNSVDICESYHMTTNRGDYCKIYNNVDGSLKYQISSPFSVTWGDYIGVNENYFVVADARGKEYDGTERVEIYIYSMSDRSLLHIIPVHEYDSSSGSYYDLSLTDDYVIFSSQSDNTVSIFSLETGILVREIVEIGFYNYSIDTDGKYIAIGAPSKAVVDIDGISQGKAGVVYIYDITDGSLFRTFENVVHTTYGTTLADRFGYSVSIEGDYLIVGAPYEDTLTDISTGSIYVFSISTGNLIYTKTSPHSEEKEYYGKTVSINKKYFVVGAPAEYDYDERGGRVYYYALWNGELIHIYENPDAVPDSNDYIGLPGEDRFGYDLKITNSGKLIVHAKYEGETSGNGEATSYVFL